jgi:hypothetical protein
VGLSCYVIIVDAIEVEPCGDVSSFFLVEEIQPGFPHMYVPLMVFMLQLFLEFCMVTWMRITLYNDAHLT